MKRILAVLIAMLATITLTFTNGQAAQAGRLLITPASVGTADCLNAYACAWTGIGATGSLYQWTAGYIWQQDGFPLTGSANNNFESLMNRTGSTIRYWDSTNCSGNNYWTMYPGQYDSSIGIYRNVPSSIDTVPGRLAGTCS